MWVSGWKKTKTLPLHFLVDNESAYLLTSCLQPLNPATSHNNNNNKNNNGRLHACVCAAEDIEPFLQLTCLVVECESQQQFDLINGPHKRFWFPCTSHFHLLLVVFGFSVYCLFVCSASLMCMLRLFFSIFGEFQVPPIGLEYELQHFWSFWVDPYGSKYSWKNAEEDGGKKDRFRMCGWAHISLVRVICQLQPKAGSERG